MKKVPKVLQQEKMDCAVACLFAIVKYYDGHIRYSKLKRLLLTKEKGTSAYSILKIGEQLGFKVEGKKGEIEQILPLEYPCIAHIKKDGYYHFVVVMGYKLHQEKVFLMDPSIGYNNVSLSYWKEICTGNYLFFKVRRTLVHEKDAPLFSLLFPKRIIPKKFFYYIIGTFSLSILEIFGLVEMKIFFSYVLTTYDSWNIVSFFAFFLFFYFLIEGGLSLFHLFFLKLQYKTFHQIMRRWIEIHLHLPYYYFEQHSKSEILSITTSLEEIYRYFYLVLECLFLECPIFIGGLFFILKESLSFFFFLIGSFFILFLSSFFLLKHLSCCIEKYLLEQEKRNAIYLDSFGKIEVLKGLHLEKFFSRKLKKEEFRYQNANYFLEVANAQKNLFNKIYRKLLKCFFLLHFLNAYFKGRTELYSYFLWDLFFEQTLNGYQKILELFFLAPKVKKEALKVADSFSYEQEQFPQKSILPVSHFKTVKVTHFAYQQEKMKAKAISFSLKQGESLLLHGPSGSGKSTLFKSILKLYPIPKGMIALEGIDVHYLNLEDIRKRICYISQEDGLFQGTLLENITLGKRRSKEEIASVLKVTHVDKIIQEKQITLEESLSAYMMPFSGGEKKKLLLARALLERKDIYLLDEVFESISKEEVVELIKNVLAYLKEKIVLVISHHQQIDYLFDYVYTLRVKK